MHSLTESHRRSVREDYITSDRLMALCDHVYWEDGFGTRAPDRGYRGGDAVFCKIDRVWECLGKLVRSPRRVILMTGQGDYPVDDSRAADAPAQVAAWYGTNATARDPRVRAMPLGLGSQKCSVTVRAAEIADKLEQAIPRTRLLYVNFRPETNPAVRGPVFARFEAMKHEPWLTFNPPASRGDNAAYLDALVRHTFALCPPGFGVDTHRMWEALYAGTIPVVLRSRAMSAFASLPILFVDDFAEVTPERLEREAARIGSSAWGTEALFLPYWRERIRAAKAELAPRPRLAPLAWASALARALRRRIRK